MMKKLFLALALIASLAACNAPAATSAPLTSPSTAPAASPSGSGAASPSGSDMMSPSPSAS